MIVNANPKSDAQWYFEEFSGDRERLYDIFFDMCKKFNVSWSKASRWTRLSLSLTSLKRPFEKISKTLLTAILIWCTLYLY